MIKPCPFCGSIKTAMQGVCYEVKWVSVVCWDCGATGPNIAMSDPDGNPVYADGMATTRAEEKWNQRNVEEKK